MKTFGNIELYEGDTKKAFVDSDGTSSVSGVSGYSGVLGTSGYSGIVGTSGYSGLVGPQGTSGYSGATPSLPQALGTGDSPTFAGATIGSLAGMLFGTTGVMSALSASDRVALVNFSKDTADASGQSDITVGWTPSLVIFLAIVHNTSQVSIGIDNAAAHLCVANEHAYSANNWIGSGNSICLIQAAGIDYVGFVATMLSNGFRISWAKNGDKTGSASIYTVAFR